VATSGRIVGRLLVLCVFVAYELRIPNPLRSRLALRGVDEALVGRDVREPVAHTLDAGAVHLELVGIGAVLAAQAPDEHESLQLEDEVVELAKADYLHRRAPFFY
jgi:hypothetical protein